MRVCLVAIGSRGDLDPFLALGARLRARGHDVHVVTHGDCAAHVRAVGLEPWLVPGSAAQLFALPELVRAMRVRPTVRRLARALPGGDPQDAAAGLLVMRGAIEAAMAAADVAVVGTGALQCLAVRPAPVPWALASWYPDTPTGAFPAMGAPRLPFGPLYNRATYAVARAREDRRLRPVLEAARVAAGLPPQGPTGLPDGTPVLYLHSRAVLPAPADWPSHVALTGGWVPPADAAPPGTEPGWPAGPAPVVVTFGSLWPVVPPGWGDVLADALVAAGHRVVVVGGPPTAPRAGVTRVAALDFARALPHASAVVHHGGFGTGSAVLRAGVPQVVVPLFVDHPWWARRAHEVGVAPRPVALRARRTDEASARRFAARVVRALGRVDARTRARAAELARVAAHDGGVDAACDHLEAWWSRTDVVAGAR